PEAGRRIFFHPRLVMCANCHTYEGRGGIVGPDLSLVSARGEPAWILQSILEPSREVAPQFYPTLLNFKDSTEFLGIKLRKGGGGREIYRDLKGGEVVIKTEEI